VGNAEINLGDHDSDELYDISEEDWFMASTSWNSSVLICTSRR